MLDILLDRMMVSGRFTNARVVNILAPIRANSDFWLNQKMGMHPCRLGWEGGTMVVECWL